MSEYTNKTPKYAHRNNHQDTLQYKKQEQSSIPPLQLFTSSALHPAFKTSHADIPTHVNPVQAFGLDTEPYADSRAEIPHYKHTVQRKENKTGLPDNLKSGIENLSGHSMDDVKVHYNSSKPTQLNAHAYAQGTDIHVASGQEKHLAHEAWHVVQQKEGRVKPTMQMQGVNINDDKGLEREADVMGGKALQMKVNDNKDIELKNIPVTKQVAQGYIFEDRDWNDKVIYYTGSEPDVKTKEKIKNTLEREDSGLAYYEYTLSYQSLDSEDKDAHLKDKDNLYIYSNEESTLTYGNSKYEISDITNEYDVTLACVLQALIAMKGGTVDGKSSAIELHNHYWSTKPDYRYYDLDEVYPKVYSAQGLSKVNGGDAKLSDLVETLESGEKYIMVAGGDGSGHNFCVQVKTVGKNRSQHNTYTPLEDEGNAHARDDIKISEYWKA